METINGIGTLYNMDGKQTIAAINYQIIYKPPTQFSFGEWWGSLNPVNDQSLLELGEYIIELEDKRRGKIIINRINAQSGLPAGYEFLGSGPIK